MQKIIFTLLSSYILLHATCSDQTTELKVGECYEKEGNSNLAQAAYERAILEDDDDNIQARLKLATLYNSMQMKTEADAILVSVNETQLSPEQRSSLALLRKTESESISSFRARVGLDLGYDSNINVSPFLDDSINGNGPDGITGTLFSRFRADMSYLHDLSTAGGWFLRTDANLYYQNNASAHDFDATYAKVYAGGGYRSENFSLYVPLFYNRLNYLDRDLLQETGILPDLDIQLTNTLILNFNAMYSARRYIQSSDQLRDDNILSGGAGLFWIEGNDMAYIKTRYESYIAINDNAIAFTNKDMYYGMIGGLYSIQDLFDLRLNYQYRFGSFEKVITPTGEGIREDSNHDFRFALERDIIKQLRLRAQYRYVTNISNYPWAEYDKNEMMLSIMYNY